MSGMLALESARRELAGRAELGQVQEYALQRSEQRVRDHLDRVDGYKGFCRRVNRLSRLKASYPTWRAHAAVKAACSNVSRGDNLHRFVRPTTWAVTWPYAVSSITLQAICPLDDPHTLVLHPWGYTPCIHIG